MNVSLHPIKSKKPRNSQILWQDHSRQNQNFNGQSQHVNDRRIVKDSKKSVADLASRIKDTDNYIRLQSDLHRRIIDHMQYDNINFNNFGQHLGYNIERRQLNLNQDDFYKNLAVDELSESDEELLNGEGVREEESKSVNLIQQEERKLASEDRRYQNFIQKQQKGKIPEGKVIPQRRVFIEVDQTNNQQQQQQ